MSQNNPSFEQFGSNSGFVQELFELYSTDPGLVSESWATYFASIEPATNGAAGTNGSTNGHGHVSAYIDERAAEQSPASVSTGAQPRALPHLSSSADAKLQE